MGVGIDIKSSLGSLGLVLIKHTLNNIFKGTTSEKKNSQDNLLPYSSLF
jgi:hypothetical protein